MKYLMVLICALFLISCKYSAREFEEVAGKTVLVVDSECTPAIKKIQSNRYRVDCKNKTYILDCYPHDGCNWSGISCNIITTVKHSHK